MNRFVILGLAATASAAVFAGPYTEGWLKPHYTADDTNIVVYADHGEGYAVSTFTNQTTRPVLKLAMATAANAAPKLAASSNVSLDGGLAKTLPEASTGRIRELARGLDYNWEKCFDFVRNYISFAVYPGIMRGPDRTLIDREGNDADQAYLLVALLRASGYESATVIYEPLIAGDSVTSGFRIPALKTGSTAVYNASDWIGFKMSYAGNVSGTHASMVARRFRMAGIPCVQYGSTDIVIPHYWVAVTVDGVTKYLDPSLKPSKTTTARDALKDMGYDRDALIAAAGGTTIAGMGVRNLSASGIASHLNTLCTNLRNVWTNANEAAEYFVGSKKIVERTDEAYFHGTYFSGAPVDLFKQTADYVNELRTKVVLTCDGQDFASFYLDEVGLRNLWLNPERAQVKGDENAIPIPGGSTNPLYGLTRLYMDDVNVATVTTRRSNGEQYLYTTEIVVDVQHKYETKHAYWLRRTSDVEDYRVYSLVFGFGGDAKNGMRKYASEELARVKATGLDDSKPRMIAASLYVQGQQWLSQCVMSLRLMNKVNNDNHQYYYNIGIAGQNGGPYVDMANCFMHSGNNTSEFGADGFFSSALEHSVVEQLNDTKAVSTVKILNLANQNGNAVYFVTSQNVDSVVNQISNYGSSFKTSMTEAAKAGASYLLPANGSTTLNEWTGTGYVKHHATEDGTVETTMAISGGMNGGYSSEYSCPNPDYYMCRYDANMCPIDAEPDNYCADPVSMPSGAYHDQKVDLVINRLTPLAWGREYDSRNARSNSGLGRGWSHIYDSHAIKSTDAESVFGLATPAHVAASVVAMLIADDMLSEQQTLSAEENARRWIIAAMATQWWTEQLNNTSVSIKTGAKTRNFLLLSDGTYVADPGETATLTGEQGQYILRERHGSKYTFNWKDLLSQIEDTSGNIITLSYTYDQATNAYLVAVENGFDARIDITWNGSSISKVTDSAGRSVEYSYDADGHLIGTKDVRGKTWTMTYDPLLHTLVSKTDPLGQRLIHNDYSEFGQVTNQISDVGGVWTFGYLSTIGAWNRNPLGFVSEQFFDEDSHALVSVSEDGSFVEAEYDGHGHLVKGIDEIGRITTFEYDANDNLVKTVDGEGAQQRVSRYEYDDQARLVRSINPAGETVTVSYDDKHRIASCRYSDGSYISNTWNDNGSLGMFCAYSKDNYCFRRKQYSYNSYGLATSITQYGKGIPSAGITSATGYNSLGWPTSKTDPKGNVIGISYDNDGNVTSVTDPYGKVSRSTYSDAGYLTQDIDPLDRVTMYARSASGKTLLKTFPDHSFLSNRFDRVDRLEETIDARGGYVRYLRDACGRVIKTITPTGESSVVYDVMGNIVQTTNAAGVVVSMEYDEHDRVKTMRNALGSTWKYTYDNLDRVLTTIDPFGKVSSKNYDVMGRVASTKSRAGFRNAFAYDMTGGLSAYTNAEQHVYQQAYDGFGRFVSATNALGICVNTASYDANGNVERTVDAEGNVIQNQYDKMDRIVSASGSDFQESCEYDDVGNLTHVSDGSVDERFTYDLNNRLSTATLTLGGREHALSWQRDIVGNITQVNYAPGKSVAKTYDLDGRLTKVSDWLGHEWTFTYDGAGKILKVAYPNAINKVYTYDVAGRLSSWNIGSIIGREITRDIAGRRVADRILNGPMPSATSLQRSNTFDAADRLTASASSTTAESFTYDKNGSMVRMLVDGVEKMGMRYNSKGQCVAISNNANIVISQYDPTGNRLRYGDKRFVPDFTDSLKRPLYECDAAGNAVRYYIWGGAELLGYIDADGEFTVVHCDDFASVVGLASIDGTAKFKAVYGPHGEIWGETGNNPTPFGWLGGFGVMHESQCTSMGDLYLSRHRIYSSRYARFVQADPTGLGGGLNLYAYGNCNPMAYIDPLGLCAEEGGMTLSDWGHTGLDVLGMIPGFGEVADGINGVWYLAEGDYGNAALSFAACVPGIGAAATSAKWAKNSVKAAKYIKGTDKVIDAAKAGNKIDNAVDAAKAANDFHPPAVLQYDFRNPKGAKIGTTQEHVLKPGDKITQYVDDGRGKSNYFTDPGTSADKLSIRDNKHWEKTYTVKEEIVAEKGTVAKDVGRSGGGTQYVTQETAGELQLEGKIELNTYRYSKFGFNR